MFYNALYPAEDLPSKHRACLDPDSKKAELRLFNRFSFGSFAPFFLKIDVGEVVFWEAGDRDPMSFDLVG